MRINPNLLLLLIAGGNINWISKSDEEIIDATLAELERLFPTEVLCLIYSFINIIH